MSTILQSNKTGNQSIKFGLKTFAFICLSFMLAIANPLNANTELATGGNSVTVGEGWLIAKSGDSEVDVVSIHLFDLETNLIAENDECGDPECSLFVAEVPSGTYIASVQLSTGYFSVQLAL